MADTFGALLKQWRGERRMSQMELGLSANVSARHISFLESGRANPSKAMIIQLSETLNVPRTNRNALLAAAGFPQAYSARDLDDADTLGADSDFVSEDEEFEFEEWADAAADLYRQWRDSLA